MSTYNTSADEAEKQLNALSPSMCYAKWAQSSIHLTNGMTNSCYHPPLHKINVDEISINPAALHNTTKKKLERQQMLNGERPDGCSYCWKIEDLGNRSDRIYRSGEYWAQNSRKAIINVLDTGNINPHYLEVNFNQACNFKCSYCSPHLSTTWEEEIKLHGPYKIITRDGTESAHNDIAYLEKEGLMPLSVKQDDNPYLQAFWKWWPELYKSLEVFRMTGGEPLMDSNMYKVLDYVYEHPNSSLELSITTNLCPPKEDLITKFIEKVKKLEEIQIWEDKDKFNPGSGNHWYVHMAVKNLALFVSLDSVGDHAEYIRHGLNFNTLDNNVNQFLTETCNTTITFINTFNLLSVPKFKEFLEYILKLRQQFSKTHQGIKTIKIYDPYYDHPDREIHPRQRIWFDVPLLRHPTWQSIQLLPSELDYMIKDALQFMKDNSNVDDFVGFYDFEIEKVERNLQYLKDRNLSNDELSTHQTNLKHFFSEHDRRRNTDFAKTFPDLSQLF